MIYSYVFFACIVSFFSGNIKFQLFGFNACDPILIKDDFINHILVGLFKKKY